MARAVTNEASLRCSTASRRSLLVGWPFAPSASPGDVLADQRRLGAGSGVPHAVRRDDRARRSPARHQNCRGRRPDCGGGVTRWRAPSLIRERSRADPRPIDATALQHPAGRVRRAAATRDRAWRAAPGCRGRPPGRCRSRRDVRRSTGAALLESRPSARSSDTRCSASRPPRRRRRSRRSDRRRCTACRLPH